MVVYRDRSYSNLGPPVNNDGVTLRPLLAPLRPTITLHYPGAPLGTSFANMAGDVKKKTYIAAVQRNAIAQGKSYEYNFFVFMDGEIWEYAGDHLAAHSAGENTVAYGVQFVNGQDDLCTDAQVVAFRWLRDVHLMARGRVVVGCACTPHREMPAASTACPGDRAIMPRLAELREPYAPPLPVPPLEDDDVKYIYIGADGRPGAILALDGSGASYLGAASPEDAEKLIAAYGAPLVPVSVAQYDEMVKCSRARGVA